MKSKLLSGLFISIFLISLAAAESMPLHPTPLDASGNLQPSTSFNYIFNFTTNPDCSGVVLSNTSTIITRSNGVGFIAIDVSEISAIPNYLCEYRDGSLRKIHTLSDELFRDVYARNINISNNLSVSGNSFFNGTLMPMISLVFDIGRPTLRWRNIFATNLSIDNIEVAGNINILGDIIGPFGNFTELFAGEINISDLDNIYLNLSGTNANQNINLGGNNLSTPAIYGLPFDFLTAIGGSSRFHIGLGGDIEMAGTFTNDGNFVIYGDFLQYRLSGLPNKQVHIYDEGIRIYDGSNDNISVINLTNAGDGIFKGNLTIGDKITFAFGEFIDNLIDGWITITGGLNVTQNLSVGGEIVSQGNIITKGRFKDGPLGGDVSPVGSIIMYAVDSVPFGWLICDGSNVSRTTYADLFGLLGESWGAGDGSTTFTLPDLRDKFIRASGTVGTTGGSDDAIVVDHTHTNSVGNQGASHKHNTVIGSHAHAFSASDVGINPTAKYTVGVTGTIHSTVYSNTFNYGTKQSGNQLTAHSHTVTINNAGSSGTDANIPAYITLRFIIKTFILVFII